MGQERFADIVERFTNGYGDWRTRFGAATLQHWQEEMEREAASLH